MRHRCTQKKRVKNRQKEEVESETGHMGREPRNNIGNNPTKKVNHDNFLDRSNKNVHLRIANT